MGVTDTMSNPGTKLKPTTSTKRLAKSNPRQRKLSLVGTLHRRTWAVPLLLITAFLSLYAINPSDSNLVYPFIFLSYKLQGTTNDFTLAPQYGKGPRDMAFVCFYTIFLTFTREFCMQELFTPLARRCGIASRAKRARFAENMYTALYIAVIGSWGMYIMHRTPVWYFNTHGMYEGFPHRTHEAGFKYYYLLQATFWLQQIVVMVLGLEARRKDFNLLIAHHVVTVTLIGLSYRFHFTYMGIAVYITHDISDFFLSVSKSLNYVESKAQGWSFGLCIVMWIYLRHYINLRILYSTLPGGQFSTVGPYVMDWGAEQYKSPLANVVAFGLLAALQLLNVFWLYCLLRAAYKFVVLGVAKDDRSEDEDMGEEQVDRPVLTANNGLKAGLVKRKSGKP
ncbi:TLC domain-containing protein [Cladorrhinum sp. PSN259]|nr:TLC domain-containing protein [Cladorrhinum sp. PSN259]